MSGEAEDLAARINASPEPLHADFTSEVRALIRLGLAALPSVLPLLEADDDLTRLRAQRVLEGVTRARIAGAASTDRERRAARRDWEALWHANGAYDWQAEAQSRGRSVVLWRGWLESEKGTC